MLRVVAIIQARMGSTRLPGKVLEDIGGRTMLARVVRRTMRAILVEKVVIATTEKDVDDAIVAESYRLGASVFRGDEEDVLDRYYRAALAHRAEIVVRITSDCPLIEPEVIDRVMGAYLEAVPDYASNCLDRTYPRGLDIEVISFAALDCAWREATESYQRAHVTPYLYQHPDRFRLLSITAATDQSAHRWTVDTPEDLAFVREVYAHLDNNDRASWTDVLNLLEREPRLLALNRLVEQKALSEG